MFRAGVPSDGAWVADGGLHAIPDDVFIRRWLGSHKHARDRGFWRVLTFRQRHLIRSSLEASVVLWNDI